MTSDDFYAAGFRACPVPPPCWQQEPGAFYTRSQAQGVAFVRYLAEHCPKGGTLEEIEAFVGDWRRPWTYWYCRSSAVTSRELLHRLS